LLLFFLGMQNCRGHRIVTTLAGILPFTKNKYEGDIEILVELIGLQNVAKINELKLQIRRTGTTGLNDALSFESRGCRSIVYDPYWASGDTPGFYLIFSHEAGHHFCGHTVSQVHLDSMAKELEADEFSGASIRRYEIYHSRGFFNQVYSAAIAKYPEKGSASYPRAPCGSQPSSAGTRMVHIAEASRR